MAPDTGGRVAPNKIDDAGASDAASHTVTSKPARSFRRLRLAGIGLLAIAGPIMALLFGSYLYVVGSRFVSTDNAYVKSEKIAVSADVSGRVVDVNVKENQEVAPGTLLLRIDPEPFRIALAQADARLASARQEIEALRAVYHQRVAALERAKGDVEFYKKQYDRQRELSSKRITSETTLETALKNLRNAEDLVAVTQADIAEARAKLGGAPDIRPDEHPKVQEALAARDQASLDLKRTEVTAPAAGIVTNFDLQPGEFIRSGNVIFTLVGTSDVWIHANFKETDLTHLKAGQPVSLRVDAYPDVRRKAVVASISPATGAEFALLPPQNATGNWVKVVQRLTVRIDLQEPNREPRLRAGMSVIVEVDTGHERSLSGLPALVFNWAREMTKGQ